MKSRHKVYAFVEAVTPPFLFKAYKASPLHSLAKRAVGADSASPAAWNAVTAGILKGAELPLGGSASWHAEMLDGSYDAFFFEYLEGRDLRGKTVFEVGAHIGFHALAFAKMVGPQGSVVAFEPNPHNASYVRQICARNKELGQRVELVEAALSSKDGDEAFVSSDKVDEGLSSGGFIGSADTIWEKSVYEERTGFTRSTVKTMRLDTFLKGRQSTPDLLKVDIEGAEGQMLEGARGFLSSHSPLVLVEVHSTKAMYDVLTLLSGLGYGWKLLKKEDDGRCFLACEKGLKMC